MKLHHLSEMALPSGGSQKTGRVRKIVTPENIAKHYDLITQILAAKLSNGDMDELAATVNGTLENEDDAEFLLTLAAKKLPVASKPEQLTPLSWLGHLSPYPVTVRGALGGKPVSLDRYFHIGFTKAKWYASFYVNSAGFATKSKKFDDATDMITWALKMYDKLEADPSKW